MQFPILSESTRLARLHLPSGRLRIVIDTDTYNEVDDQFAVAYALLAPERLVVEAIYAAPFHNSRSSSPADGMQRSYDEILRLLSMMNRAEAHTVLKGSTRYLDMTAPEDSPAVRDLIERAMSSTVQDPLYVVAFAAITNIATAILLEPLIIEKIVVVWLGGHALHWPHTREFNLRQDVLAARLVFDSGVPLVHIPCDGVTTHLQSTVAELEHYLAGKNALCDYLVGIVRDYEGDPFAWSKVIWDISTIAYLVNPAWVPTMFVHSPVLTADVTWSVDPLRHLMRYAYHVYRDPILGDLFRRLSDMEASSPGFIS